MKQAPRFDVTVTEEAGLAVVDVVTDLPDGAELNFYRSREIQVSGEAEVREAQDGSADAAVRGGRAHVEMAEEPGRLANVLNLGSDFSIDVLPSVAVSVTFNPNEQSSQILARVGGKACPRCEGSPAAFLAGTGTSTPSTWLQVSQSIPFSPPA